MKKRQISLSSLPPSLYGVNLPDTPPPAHAAPLCQKSLPDPSSTLFLFLITASTPGTGSYFPILPLVLQFLLWDCFLSFQTNPHSCDKPFSHQALLPHITGTNVRSEIHALLSAITVFLSEITTLLPKLPCPEKKHHASDISVLASEITAILSEVSISCQKSLYFCPKPSCSCQKAPALLTGRPVSCQKSLLPPWETAARGPARPSSRQDTQSCLSRSGIGSFPATPLLRAVRTCFAASF